jgi:hypothetical protein
MFGPIFCFSMIILVLYVVYRDTVRGQRGR